MSARPFVCEQAQRWASSRLDDELSEFESALLDLHLGLCADCRELALDVSAFTTVLRSVPPAEPVTPITMPRLRQRRLHFRASEVAVAVALVIGTAGALELAGSPGPSGGSPQLDRPEVSVSTTPDDTLGVVAARRAHLLAMTSRWWIPRRGFQLT
jgi:hypothetical protein